MKDFLSSSTCLLCGFGFPILLQELGIIPKSAVDGLYIVLVFITLFGLRFLCDKIGELIAYLRKDKEGKKQLHIQKWNSVVSKFLFNNSRGKAGYEKCGKLMDKLFKDKLISLEDKKVLYDRLCLMWTDYEFDTGEVHYNTPPEIQMKWKKAQADDKLRQLKKDF